MNAVLGWTLSALLMAWHPHSTADAPVAKEKLLGVFQALSGTSKVTLVQEISRDKGICGIGFSLVGVDVSEQQMRPISVSGSYALRRNGDVMAWLLSLVANDVQGSTPPEFRPIQVGEVRLRSEATTIAPHGTVPDNLTAHVFPVSEQSTSVLRELLSSGTLKLSFTRGPGKPAIPIEVDAMLVNLKVDGDKVERTRSREPIAKLSNCISTLSKGGDEVGNQSESK